MASPFNHLLTACRAGDVDAVRGLLQSGLDVNACGGGDFGLTPLATAALHGQIEMAAYLLEEAGADVNAGNKRGETALHWARSDEIAARLLSSGADVHARTNEGRTPLHWACIFLRDDAVKVLLKAGADVGIVGMDGELPIEDAVKKGAGSPDRLGALARILYELVDHGAQWSQSCEELILQHFESPEAERRWQRVGPALRFAVHLWVEERELGVALTPVPEEEIEKGLEATRTFVSELKASTRIVCRRTIGVVGPSTAGKTSLIKSLVENAVRLELLEDRTIGIDHFALAFDEPESTPSTAAVRRSHEVKFSDFAGQNVYQPMHSLFFTHRTLFMLCIDLNAYSIALLRCEMLTPDEAKLQHLMNEYVDRTVLSWIRIILGRQPEAEFVFVCTKEDTISCGPGVDKVEVLTHVKKMLERVMVIVDGMRLGAKRDRHGQHEMIKQQIAKPITHLWDARLERVHKPNVTIIVTDSTTTQSVQHARSQVEELLMASGKSYETPEKYVEVLKELLSRKAAASDGIANGTLQQTFTDVNELIEELQESVPGLEDGEAVKNILRTLRDCVDILWYEDMTDAKLQTTVILDPKTLIEFLRQVINHNHATGVICHATLSGLPYWRELNSDEDAMLAMKRLLQTFRLVHPASGEMAFDSDLIVPMYWKANTAALWMFGGEDLRLNPRGMGIETVARRVHWEFRFTHFIPETLFDHLVVAGYSPFHPLEAGPDWLLYRDGAFAACRVMISRHWKTHERSLLLEAVLSEDPTVPDSTKDGLWATFQRVCEALVCVLKEHPGLAVTSFAHSAVEDHKPSLSSILHAMTKGSIMDTTWMPPEPTASECVRRLMER